MKELKSWAATIKYEEDDTIIRIVKDNLNGYLIDFNSFDERGENIASQKIVLRKDTAILLSELITKHIGKKR